MVFQLSHFKSNLKHLRKSADLTQQGLADAVNDKLLKRTNICSYEEGAEPKLGRAYSIARYFGVTLDDMVSIDLSKKKKNITSKEDLVNEIIRLNKQLVKIIK